MTVEVLLKAAGGLLLELCVHLDRGLHPEALPEADGPVNLRQTHAQRELELQETRDGPCCGGQVPAFQPHLAPLQRRGGYADALTSTLLGQSCALKLVGRRCVPCAALLGIPDPPRK